MSFVLDSSVALSWCFQDEKSVVTELLLDRIQAGEGLVVPLIWSAEVLNGLVVAARRKRISVEQGEQQTKFLNLLPMEIDVETNDRIWTDTIKLANRHRLTIYDATYLELASRRKLPLATLDKDLQKAGKKMGLEILGS